MAVKISELPNTQAVKAISGAITLDGVLGSVTPAAATVTTLSATNDITISTGKAIKTDTTTGHTLKFQAYDVDGTAYKDFITFTNGNTPTAAITAPSGGAITIDGAAIGGTTPVSIRGYAPSATTFSGTTGTLALVDAEYFQVCSNGSAQTITIPTNGTIAFPIDTEICFIQDGAGQTGFAAAGGVTLLSVNSGTKIASRYGVAVLKKTGSDTWYLFGDITV